MRCVCTHTQAEFLTGNKTPHNLKALCIPSPSILSYSNQRHGSPKMGLRAPQQKSPCCLSDSTQTVQSHSPHQPCHLSPSHPLQAQVWLSPHRALCTRMKHSHPLSSLLEQASPDRFSHHSQLLLSGGNSFTAYLNVTNHSLPFQRRRPCKQP